MWQRIECFQSKLQSSALGFRIQTDLPHKSPDLITIDKKDKEVWIVEMALWRQKKRREQAVEKSQNTKICK